jgi:hypothetical protein
MPNKLIALRVQDTLYDMIKTLAVFTNNTLAGYTESCLLQNIPQRYNAIPKDKLAEIKKIMEEK